MSLGNVNKFVKGDHFCTKHFNHIVQSIADLWYKYIASIVQIKDIKDKRSTIKSPSKIRIFVSFLLCSRTGVGRHG